MKKEKFEEIMEATEPREDAEVTTEVASQGHYRLETVRGRTEEVLAYASHLVKRDRKIVDDWYSHTRWGVKSVESNGPTGLTVVMSKNLYAGD